MDRLWLKLVLRGITALVIFTIVVAILPALLLGALSPEGDVVAFMYSAGSSSVGSPVDNWDLYLLDVQTRVTAPLTNTPYRERFPKWSPDGSTIAYHANPELSYDLYLMDSKGRNIQSLADLSRSPTSNEAMVDWSPDGSAIIFHSGFGEIDDYHLYISAPSRGLFRELLPEMPDSIFGAWSPDGSHIAFSSTIGGIMTLHVMDTGRVAPLQLIWQSSPVHRLTDGSFDAASPDWSPDGTQIVYMLDRGGADDIYIINIDGTNPRNISRSLYANNAYPEWLSDGRIIFSSNRQSSNYDLYIMNADGSNVRRLTNLPGDELAPSWKP